MQMEYTGPGRAIPEPEHVDDGEDRLHRPDHARPSPWPPAARATRRPWASPMLQGCQLAIEEANAHGGYLKRKIPFELVVSNDNGLWGSSGNEIINMAYKDNGLGHPRHHRRRQQPHRHPRGAQGRDPDDEHRRHRPTFIETNIPWVMRCIGDDRQMNYLLVDYLTASWTSSASASSAPATATAASASARSATAAGGWASPIVIEMAYKVGADGLLAATRAAEEANARRHRPLGRRRRRRPRSSTRCGAWA